MSPIELENLLSNILSNPERYIIIDKEREYTMARFSKIFNYPVSTINNWCMYNKVRMRHIPELNNLNLIQLDIPTMVDLKLHDVMDRIIKENTLTDFYRALNVVGANSEWISKAMDIIDSEIDKDIRYSLIDNLRKKMEEIKYERKKRKPGPKPGLKKHKDEISNMVDLLEDPQFKPRKPYTKKDSK